LIICQFDFDPGAPRVAALATANLAYAMRLGTARVESVIHFLDFVA
jgi:hypothetical protein